MDIREKLQELVIDNKELAFMLLNSFKEPIIRYKNKEKTPEELILLNKELAEELMNTHGELAVQIEQNEKQAIELRTANKELAFQNEEKAKRAEELVTANKELAFQNEEKAKRAEELVTANKELAFQNEEKAKRAEELVTANKELAFQNEEKAKRAEELVTANKELTFQNEQKVKRTADLIIAKEKLTYQSELAIANKELAFQYEEKAKRADELIIINNELKQLLRLNSDKDLFISILGHDLKNPFNNILGFSEILTDEIDGLNKEEIKDIAKNINESAQNANNLLEEILLWARTQQGKLPFKPLKINFADICKNILEILKPNANAKNITINYSTSDNLDIFADIDMLKAILRNLVTNAIKFSYPGGTININAEQTKSNITISVSDNGVGISPQNLTKLFDISQVFTIKGTAEEIGTGLGLSLCKGFVEKHGGKIWVESEVGNGSQFIFSLPISVDLLM